MNDEHIFSSVWDALANTTQEAAHLTLRSTLMIELNESIKKWPGTDTEKAARLGITKPRFSNLKSGCSALTPWSIWRQMQGLLFPCVWMQPDYKPGVDV
ncbi:XRE family transcriptional regulator [Pseudomonas sp. KFB-139]|uniref:XRE family transcriptional regulator n=1 Tax=Pseudomonas serbiensis TaxID=3064350 RepID=A0ABT9CVA0_9PSED|nr:XRE family transcriptional regulator [Pseudomonas sp. KFB-138]MDO7929414.1 XRE family transcriptional regulator [Pseudomonas sp. KFB-138]